MMRLDLLNPFQVDTGLHASMHMLNACMQPFVVAALCTASMHAVAQGVVPQSHILCF